MDIEFKKPEEIKEFQEGLLHEALVYLKDHSKYYQRMFEKYHIDIEKIRADILQLWAEGAEIYKTDGGEKLHRGIEQYQETENEKHILCDSWEDEILSWIEMQDAAGESGYR